MLKVKPFRNAAYRAWIRTLPCAHCKAPADHAHHAIYEGCSGMGTKASDFGCAPLCRSCHRAVHLAIPGTFPQLKWILDTLDRAKSDGVIND